MIATHNETQQKTDNDKQNVYRTTKASNDEQNVYREMKAGKITEVHSLEVELFIYLLMVPTGTYLYLSKTKIFLFLILISPSLHTSHFTFTPTVISSTSALLILRTFV